jgi:hypothetical protein
VAGVDLNRVAGRYERDGSVDGWATLTGEWLGSAIRVEYQSDAQPPRERLTDWTVRPFRPTASGWLLCLVDGRPGHREVAEGATLRR